MNPLYRLGDAHCHLSVESNQSLCHQLLHTLNHHYSHLHPRFFRLMSTNHIDIDLIDMMVDQLNHSTPLLYPYFGIHPWYSHLFTDLDCDKYQHDLNQLKHDHYGNTLSPPPSSEFLEMLPIPLSLSKHLQKIELLCIKHKVYGIGEIGLDKLFRIPTNGYYGNQMIANDGDIKLSPYRVKIHHQLNVFEAQLQLANRLQTSVSVHCVKAHGPLYDIVTKYNQISQVALHSFSGSIDQAKLWIRKYGPKDMNKSLVFSFSNYINGVDAKESHLKAILNELQNDQILIETDISIDKHLQEDYWDHLKGIKERIEGIKGWGEDEFMTVMTDNMDGMRTKSK